MMRKILLACNLLILLFCIIGLAAEGWSRAAYGGADVTQGIFSITETFSFGASTTTKTININDYCNTAQNSLEQSNCSKVHAVQAGQIIGFFFFLFASLMGASLVRAEGKGETPPSSFKIAAGLTLFAAFWEMVAFSAYSSYLTGIQNQQGLVQADYTLSYCFALAILSWLMGAGVGVFYFILPARENANQNSMQQSLTENGAYGQF